MLTILEKFKLVIEIFVICENDTHNDVTMAVDIFCNGVYYEIGSEVNRTLEIRRYESIVNSQQYFVFAGDGCNCGNVDYFESRICKAFNPD